VICSLARFYEAYDPESADREMIFCPYCYEQIAEDTVLCPGCRQDTTRDAKVEMDRADLARMQRASCLSCGRQILAAANTCRFCRTRQRGLGLAPA